MDKSKLIFDNIWYTRIIHSLIVIALALISYKFVVYFLTRGEKNSKIKLFTSSKGKTFINLMKSIIKSVLLILTTLVILQINGVNVSSVLAGVGIFRVIFGKNILNGSMLINRFVSFYFYVIVSSIVVVINGIKTKNVIGEVDRNIKEIDG